ncbi:hypothetical protein M493_08115 [Geobacillus genomosp. 3]|uniref:Uncharacterized protein n=1 Tax=Geobacillus genomosp. 3 TaxID=1921421 RepID=S5Z4N4_GEOG3|nr:hypothetical protein M493_08115 [Geobacillus genomosp. 3]
MVDAAGWRLFSYAAGGMLEGRLVCDSFIGEGGLISKDG